MEQQIVTGESSLPFRALPAAALRGRNPLTVARNSAVLLAGVLAALRLLRDSRPAAILGTGGYVCVPLFLAARLAGVPTLIYLPDVVPGLAVRFLARIATAVACSVADSLPQLGITAANRQRATVTGYPVRSELFAQDRLACRARFDLSSILPVLLVYGGSRGARSLNQAIAALLPNLLVFSQIIHVCGREGDAEWLSAAAAELAPELRRRYRLYPYLASGRPLPTPGGMAAAPGRSAEPSMIHAFGAADLAVCRSGASVLAELPAAALPAILVPYPYVHQDENADYLVRHGAAVKVADAAMLGAGRPQDGPLFTHISRLLRDPHARRHMAAQSQTLARPDAAHALAGALINLATRSGC